LVVTEEARLLDVFFDVRKKHCAVRRAEDRKVSADLSECGVDSAFRTIWASVLSDERVRPRDTERLVEHRWVRARYEPRLSREEERTPEEPSLNEAGTQRVRKTNLSGWTFRSGMIGNLGLFGV
jgi:hypothetical protein